MANGVNSQSTDISFIAFDFVEDNNADILPENVEVEIVANNSMIVAQYVFNNGDNVLPTFNSGFVYEYTDVDNGNGTTTRTISSDDLPTKIEFDDCNVTEIIYLNTANVFKLGEMFYGCELLTKVPDDISDWGKNGTGNIYNMIDGCVQLSNKELTANNWRITSEDLTAFITNTLIEKINVNNWDFTNRVNGDIYADSFMCDNSKLKEVSMENWNLSELAYFEFADAFKNCISLEKINMQGLTFGDNENIYLSYTNIVTGEYTAPFINCPSLNYIDLQNADISAINGIIKVLPTRSVDSKGTLNLKGISDLSQIDIATANSKYWDIKSTTYFNGNDTHKLYLGDISIERMYLGNILIYVQPVDVVQFIDNTIYVNNVDMNYSEEEKTLYIDEDNLNYDDEQHNLRIEGDE